MKKLLFITILIFMVTVTGCWSRREVEDLAIVGGLGFDKITVDGRDKYRISALVFKPGAMGGGPQEGSGQTAATYWVVSAIGDTLLEAGQNMSSRSSRIVFFAHSDVLIIGERLAREDNMERVMDLLLRNKDLRLRNLVFVVEGEAVSVFEEAQPELETTLTQEISRLSEESMTRLAKAYVPDVKDFVVCLLVPGRDPLAGRLEIFSPPERPTHPVGETQPQTSVRLNGAAVFSGGKLAGWLTDTETTGFLYVFGKAEGGILPVRLPDGQEGSISLRVSKVRTAVIPTVRDNRIGVSLEVKVEARVGDVEDSFRVAKPENVAPLEKQAAAKVKQIIEDMITKTQDLRADICGFGREVHIKYPKEWKRIKTDWRSIYANLPVKVNVEVKIRGTGMLGNPIAARTEK